MLVLSTTSMVVRVVTGAAGDIRVGYSYVDVPKPFTTSSSSDVVGDNAPAITTAATTPIATAPALNFARNFKDFRVTNKHATVSNPITVEVFDGTAADNSQGWSGTLLPGEIVYMNEVGDWLLRGADGIIKPPSIATVQQLPNAGGTVTNADADTLKLFASKMAGDMALRYIGPGGNMKTVQPLISEGGFSMYLPNNGTTIGLNQGLAWTAGGTVSHPTPSSTAPAIYNQKKRTRFANVVTTTNQFLGLRTATAEKQYWRGNAAGLGGFCFHARFAIGLWPAATVRLFVGLNNSNAGWVISDTLTGNGCGLWHDTTEAATVLNFVTRDGTTATKTPIGLVAALAAGQAFDFWMCCMPNGSAIGYKLVDLNTGTTLADTTTSTTLPLSTAFLGQELAMSNGTANITVTTVAMEVASHTCRSDN